MTQEMDVIVTNIDNGKLDFQWDNLKPEFEQVLKSHINQLGGNNSAYTPDILPQDKLAKAWGWVHGNCGLVVQALWESGRQDGFVIAEYPQAHEGVYESFEQWIKPLFGTATAPLVMMKREQDGLLENLHVSDNSFEHVQTA